MPPVSENQRFLLDLTRVRLSQEEIMLHLRNMDPSAREAFIDDIIFRPLGYERRPRPEWDQTAVDLIVWLYRLGVTTQEIRRQMNFYGWVVDHGQIIRALKMHESRSMASNPNFVW